MILAVSQIHYINFPFFRVLSLFYKVKTLRMPGILRKYKGAIEVLNSDEQISCDQKTQWQDQAVDQWEKYREGLRGGDWSASIAGVEVDFTAKARQVLAAQCTDDFILKEMSRKLYPSEDFYYVESLSNQILKTGPQDNSALRWISLCNRVLDLIYTKLINAMLGMRSMVECVLGCIVALPRKTIKYIYDGVAPSELPLRPGGILFNWLVDGRQIHADEILYILPDKEVAKKDLDLKGFQAVFKSQLFCYYQRSCAVKTLGKVLWVGLINLVALSPRRLMRLRFELQALRWVPLAQNLQPQLYMTSFSAIGSEDAGIAYWNARGVQTVMWAYGSNSYLFTMDQSPCQFRNAVFCDLLSSHFMVWSKLFKDFVQSHPQLQTSVEVIGPLMCGDESIMGKTKIERFRLFNLPYQEGFKYISLFDVVPHICRGRQPFADQHPLDHEQYHAAFMQDILRLLEEFPQLILIYKPKRDFRHPRVSYSASFKQLLAVMLKHPRVHILSHDIDPWAGIALSDLCICMPFESPGIAALHYGIPTVFYDPCGIVQQHRYGKFSHLLLAHEAALTKYICTYLASTVQVDMASIKDLVGIHPQANSSDLFRAKLKNLI